MIFPINMPVAFIPAGIMILDANSFFIARKKFQSFPTGPVVKSTKCAPRWRFSEFDWGEWSKSTIIASAPINKYNDRFRIII